MKINGIDGMTVGELLVAVDDGGKFVVYMYCFSILIMTFWRSSNVYFVRSGESVAAKGWFYSLISLLFGWWGFPWGFIYTPQCLFTNLSGGKDVTESVMAALIFE